MVTKELHKILYCIFDFDLKYNIPAQYKAQVYDLYQGARQTGETPAKLPRNVSRIDKSPMIVFDRQTVERPHRRIKLEPKLNINYPPHKDLIQSGDTGVRYTDRRRNNLSESLNPLI